MLGILFTGISKADLSCSGLHYVYGHDTDNLYHLDLARHLVPLVGWATPQNAASVQPAALAELQMTGFSALMTYRLELCGVHVSGQCWAYCKNSRSGREGEPMASPCPVRQRFGPWIVSHHASPPTDHKWRMRRANGGKGRGLQREALQLKRLSSCKLKRHYLLTWRCPLWGRTLGFKQWEKKGDKKRRAKGRKKVWIVEGVEKVSAGIVWNNVQTFAHLSGNTFIRSTHFYSKRSNKNYWGPSTLRQHFVKTEIRFMSPKMVFQKWKTK